MKIDAELQAEPIADDRSCSGFDLYEVGAIADAETFIDAKWRKETRPKRMRPRSTENYGSGSMSKRDMLDGASFDTSSHHTVDYLVETRSAKSYTFGVDG